VVISTNSIEAPDLRSSSATQLACHWANWLARVPMRTWGAVTTGRYPSKVPGGNNGEGVIVDPGSPASNRYSLTGAGSEDADFWEPSCSASAWEICGAGTTTPQLTMN